MFGGAAMTRVLAVATMALPLAILLGGDGGFGSPSATTVRFVAANGSDARQCTQSAPCASFNRAWQLAQPGDVVEVAGGSYPGQTLAPASKSSSALVVFRPASGARVTISGDFETGGRTQNAGAQHFELRDFTVTGYVSLAWGAEDVTLRNLDASGFDLNSARRVRVLGGDWGPTVDGYSSINACGVSGCFPAEDILIDGAYFHDYLLSESGVVNDVHMQCIQIWPGRRVTIRNSTFRNCTDFGVLVDPYNTALVGSPGDLVFENNFFDEPMPGDVATVQCNPSCPRGGSAISLKDREGWSGVSIRYNSSLGDIQVDPGVRGVRIKGNIGPKRESFFCTAGSDTVYDHNVWSGARCSASDRTAPLSNVFRGASSIGFDLRLKPGSRAGGAGDPMDHPKRDIKGRLRPVAFAPDAGAWQREPALVVPGRSIGTASIGMRREDVADFYGPNPRRVTVKLADGSRADVDDYRVQGGRLRVTYRGEKAIAISTTSRYYQTARGLGPGAPLKARAQDDGRCRPVGAGAGKARLYVRPTRSKKPVVAEIVVVAARFKPSCAVASSRG